MRQLHMYVPANTTEILNRFSSALHYMAYKHVLVLVHVHTSMPTSQTHHHLASCRSLSLPQEQVFPYEVGMHTNLSHDSNPKRKQPRE